MTERERFERRLEASVRDYVKAAPTEIDAARLTRALSTNVPRTRRLIALPALRLPAPAFAWVLAVVGLLAVLGTGLVASGALRNPATTFVGAVEEARPGEDDPTGQALRTALR